MSDDLRNRVARAIAYSGDLREKREWSELLPETRNHYRKQADAALAEMGGVRVKPLQWEYHPAGKIAAPPTGHAYIIDTRMKGCVHSIKGFNPQREFVSLDEAKAAAQADYEARILAAIEPAAVSVLEAARVLLDWTAYNVHGAGQDFADDLGEQGLTALRAIAEGEDDD